MRGVGGPLLCIGDLLSDVADDDSGAAGDHRQETITSPLSPPSPSEPIRPSDLHQLFQENYNQLTKSLMGTDHSWTALTLKLCASLETADKLVHSTSSNVEFLVEKVNMLESIIKRGDSAVALAKTIDVMKLRK